MADIMSKEFEMRFRPFVDVRVGIPHMQDDYSGFKIPLEMLLLGELPFRLTKVELETRLGEDEILKLVSQRDIVLTREKPSLRQCVKGFSDERILHYYEARKNNSSKKPIEISYLSIYCKNMEEKEELFQRLPVPHRNYHKLDCICDPCSGTTSAFGRRDSADLDDF
jgi:hypothetical protein